MPSNITVGVPTSKSDGTKGHLRRGKRGTLITAKGHGSNHEQTSRGNVYSLVLPTTSGTIGAGQCVGAYEQDVVHFALWNPHDSNVNLVIRKFGVWPVSGTAPIPPVFHGWFRGVPTVTPTYVQPITCNQPNLPKNCIAQGFTSTAAAALTGGSRPQILRAADLCITAGAGVANLAGLRFMEEVQGDIVIAPGTTWLPLWMSDAALLHGYSVTWEEVPIVPTTFISSRNDATFTPLDIPNCALWLEADRGITITGSGVSAWADQSGNNRTPIQGTDGNRIPYVASAINGLPALNCDASAKYLSVVNSLGSNIAQMTIINVCTATTTAGNRMLNDFGTSCMAVYTSATTFHNFISDTGSNTGYYTPATAGTKIWTQVYDGSQATDALKLKVFSAGTQKTLTFNGTIPANLSNKLTKISIGASGTPDSYWEGYYSVMIVYLRALSDAERLRLERFYGAKYGIAVA